MPLTTTVNPCFTSEQQNTYDKFIDFLLSPEEDFYIFGAAGCGKTFLAEHLFNQGVLDYLNICKVSGVPPISAVQNFAFTAPTNKAVQVLQEQVQARESSSLSFSTVYSFFGLTVIEDFKTGISRVVPKKNYSGVADTLVFIDECSMLTPQVLEHIKKTSFGCKFVFIGDIYQLAPIEGMVDWEKHTNANYLYTPVRNKGNSALINLCAQLRETVKTGKFKDIQLVHGSIEQLNVAQAKDWLVKTDYTTSRVLSFTNANVNQYIDLIFSSKHPTLDMYAVGMSYINNSPARMNKASSSVIPNFYAEEPVTITSILTDYLTFSAGNYHLGVLHARVASLNKGRSSSVSMHIAKDPKEYAAVLKQSYANKDFTAYYTFKQCVMDLRLPYASSVHKAQGNTFKEVYIDLDSFNYCKDSNVMARLLYVAVSRAQEKVYFYGSLPKQYGELV